KRDPKPTAGPFDRIITMWRAGRCDNPPLINACWRGVWPLALGSGLVLFLVVPDLSELDAVTRHWYCLVGWTLASLPACAACLTTALHSTGTDRKVWYSFGYGSLLWFSAILYWVVLDLEGGVQFPSAADVGFLASTFTYISGMYYFSSIAAISRIQICNLGLILCQWETPPGVFNRMGTPDEIAAAVAFLARAEAS